MKNFRSLKLLNERFVEPWLWWDWLYYLLPSGREYNRCLNILQTFTKNVILKRDAEFDDFDFSSKNKFAFLDILLKTKREDSSLTFQDIQEEVDTFMFEGHDTTASGLVWTILLIAEHSDVQQKLHKEIDEHLGLTSKSITSDDLRNLKYLDCVIKESLRLHSPAPIIGRRITENCEIAGHKLEINDSVFINICAIHRDERYFPDPEKFNPDRFLDENPTDKHPFCYIPFSAGRRNCIGQKFAQMELKIILAYILRTFKISSNIRLNDIIQVSELTLHSTSDIVVNFENRF